MIVVVFDERCRCGNECAERGLSSDHYRVRALEAERIILHRVALLNRLSVGAGINIFIQVTLEHQIDAQLEKFEVMKCYLITGDAGYHLRVVVADLMSLQNSIVEKLSKALSVSNIRPCFSLKQIKYKTALLIMDLMGADARQSRSRWPARR